MATQKVTRTQKRNPATKLLKPTEVAFSKKLSSGKTLQSKRAQVLLALHEGITQAKAGKQAGLTLDQVKYCIRRFRMHRLKMFTVDAASAKQPKKVAVSRRAPAKKTTRRPAAVKQAEKQEESVKKKAAKKLKKAKSKKDTAKKEKAKKAKPKTPKSTKKAKKKK